MNHPPLRILTDRGIAYCGKVESHDYQLYLVLNDIKHKKAKARSPQTNGICERFHKAILQEFYQVIFHKTIFSSIDELQKQLNEWTLQHNKQRTYQGKRCCGRTPMQTLIEGKTIWRDKKLN